MKYVAILFFLFLPVLATAQEGTSILQDGASMAQDGLATAQEGVTSVQETVQEEVSSAVGALESRFTEFEQHIGAAISNLYGQVQDIDGGDGLSTRQVIVVGVGASVGYLAGTLATGGTLIPVSIAAASGGTASASAVGTWATMIGMIGGAALANYFFN